MRSKKKTSRGDIDQTPIKWIFWAASHHIGRKIHPQRWYTITSSLVYRWWHVSIDSLYPMQSANVWIFRVNRYLQSRLFFMNLKIHPIRLRCVCLINVIVFQCSGQFKAQPLHKALPHISAIYDERNFGVEFWGGNVTDFSRRLLRTIFLYLTSCYARIDIYTRRAWI